jgi:colanic acid/amylovoran biosynthesis glycosyltransferase
MRVLLFSDLFCEDTTTFIYNEVKGLVSRNHEVMYLCTERINEKKFPFDNVAEIPYYVNPLLRKIRWYLEIYDQHLTFKNGIYSHKITRVIEDFKPDIIHCHFGYQALKLLDNYDYNHIPVVVTFHGYDATFKFNRKSYVESIKNHVQNENMHIFLACAFFKERFIKNNIPLDKATVVYCGIDTHLFKRTHYDYDATPFNFVQVSSFHTKKGHQFTVLAFKKLLEAHPDFNCRLVFGGHGDHMEEIRQLARQLGIEDRVIFKGLVTPAEAKLLLENGHCFVHHSITSETGDSEACTNSIMEAMAMELPVLSTRHGGIPEMVEDGVHGFLVEEKDVDTYAKKMWEIKSWGYLKENREHIQRKFDLDIHISNLEEHFKDIIRMANSSKQVY